MEKVESRRSPLEWEQLRANESKWVELIGSLTEGSFYEVGGGERPVFQYMDDEALAKSLADRMTIIDCMDESEVQCERSWETHSIVAKGYIEADMRTPLLIEPKQAVFIKDALCWFDTDQAFKNILSMTEQNGIIFIIDAKTVIDDFLGSCSSIAELVVIDEYIYPYCAFCGEGSPSDCSKIGDCSVFAPYSYIAIRKLR